MVSTSQKSWVVSLSTFPPRECGIASFTRDFGQALDNLFSPHIESKIVAMNMDNVTRLKYAEEVIFEISQVRQSDYKLAAEKLNAMNQVKLVSVQHEFGIFGGDHGNYLLDFTNNLKKPLSITFHTVLPNPGDVMKDVVGKLCGRAEMVVVMTENAKRILERDYLVSESKIIVIPHGIHPMPFKSSDKEKKALKLNPKNITLTTFGLLSKGKGIEYVIEALPEVVEKYPNISYLVIGATHPVVLRQEGETYRNFLISRVEELGLTSHVHFYNKYFENEELFKFLTATDIYLSTSLDPNQTVSGTLSYALGAGRPVITTSFPQAKEYVTAEVGTLVAFRDSKDMAHAILDLLGNEEKRLSLGKNAYFKTRNMVWSNVVIAYMRAFSKLIPDLEVNSKRAPKIKLSHLEKLTDDFGIIQFAHMAEPETSSGYTLDDNARALIFTTRYYEKTKLKKAEELAQIYLNFLDFVWQSDGTYGNYVNVSQEIGHEQNKKENLDDANGRALYALAVACTREALSKSMRDKARSLYEKSIKAAENFTSPRAQAFFIKSLALFIEKEKNEEYLNKLTKACDFLVNEYKQNSKDEWQWFEHILAYSNAVLSEALIVGYEVTGNKEYLEIGKKTLDFLISHTFEKNIYIPIGQGGWFKRKSHRYRFDQQPEDVASTVEALNSMYRVSKDEKYKKLAHQAFDWFLGGNMLGRIMYDELTGGCFDGLGEKEVNLNEGAESTLAYLLSRLVL